MGKTDSEPVEVLGESAADGVVELQDVIAQNPDVFGWIYIPGTNIDYPVAQNMDGDDSYYENHDPSGFKESSKGGIYISAANLMDMTDFNTVIHGKTTDDGDMFSQLWSFEDEKFFNEHDRFAIFIDGNVLEYEVWTAYERENTNLLEKYDFTEYDGCKQFLTEMKKDWTTATNIREGWEQGASPENFLVTLTTVNPKNPSKQLVVVGCMIGDAAGTINREMEQDYQ
ncbi:class B sortase [Butyrivibrio sp. WCD3002]|uniref:class B sortase n=1 Tax=Butyrivibrio sp. WCD3002 TaxID=1280676 RepID=UPI00041BDA71|nr:class B sortase [Butyrivibrio sp. WCD3002]